MAPFPMPSAAPSRRAATARRDGMALLLALGAIIVIGGLVAGAFFVSTRDVRSGRSSLAQETAQMSTEDALQRVRAIYADSAPSNLTTDGQTFTVATGVAGATVQVTRLMADAFLLTSSASSGSAVGAGESARRRASMVLVRNVPSMTFPSALTVNGNITVGGSSEISGDDTSPSGWACSGSETDKPGLMVPPSTTPTYTGAACRGGACIEGSPTNVVKSSTAADTNTYFKYGSTTWDDLVARATIKLSGATLKIAPSVVGGVCNGSDVYNWGDPTRPAGACATRFPIVYVKGDATINGEKGQGILLVDGDLSVQGGFEFYGPVIVRGTLKTAGTGGHFNGGVMAYSVEMDANKVIGDALVQYSSCAIETALKMSSPPTAVRRRAWADLY